MADTDNMFDKLGSLLRDYISDEKSQNEFIQSQKSDKKNENAQNEPKVKFISAEMLNAHQEIHKAQKDWKKTLPRIKKTGKVIKQNLPPKELHPDFSKLGVGLGSSLDECKTAYKNLIKKYHPDLYIGRPKDYENATKISASVTESFNRIQEWFRKNEN